MERVPRHRVHGPDANQRDLQFVSPGTCTFKELPLLGDMPGQNLTNFIDDRNRN